MRKVMIFIVMVLAATGCATQPAPAQPDPSLEALKAAARQIEQELRQLVLLQTGNKQQGGLRAVLPKDGPLGKSTTMQWAGPIGPAVKQIAKQIRYKYRVIGAAPAAPITVSIDVTKEKAYTVLDSIAWQAAGKAQLLVDPLKKQLTLAYLPTFGGDAAPELSSHTAHE